MTKKRPAARRSTARSTRRPARTRRARSTSPRGKKTADGWPTAITRIEQNKILVRGYSLDELMGRVSFAEAVYLVLCGELPSRDVGLLIDALLVASIDHGATPPSTVAARNVATTLAPPRTAAAAGVLAFGSPLGGGGSIAGCYQFLDEGLALVVGAASYDDAATRMIARSAPNGGVPPGFGHRFHTRDPRAARLLQLALELDLEGQHIQLIRAVERVLAERDAVDATAPPLLINADGAIAAVCGDLGLDADTANALFTISRLPGLLAHTFEEQRRNPPMRQIDPSSHIYDGPRERRLPETRR